MEPSRERSARPSIPVTVNIPPPAAVFEELLASRGIGLQPGEIIGSIIPHPEEEVLQSNTQLKPFDPTIGDVKMTLDDLKSFVLHYYAKLYQNEGESVDERLDAIQQYHYPSPFPISGAQRRPTPEQPRPLTADTRSPRHLSFLPPLAQTAFTSSHPLGRLDSSLSPAREANMLPPMFDPRHHPGLDRVPPPSRYPAGFDPFIPGGELRHFNAPADGANFFGLLSTDAGAPHSSHCDRENVMGRPIEAPNGQPSGHPAGLGQGIADVLRDVKKEVDAATRRLTGVRDELFRETDDPTLTAFGYANYPKVKRRPCFGTQRHRMRVLQMNTLAPLAKIRDDPRLGY